MKVKKYYLPHTIISSHLLQIYFGVQVLCNNTWFRREIYSTAYSMPYIFLPETKNAFPVFTDLGLIILFSLLCLILFQSQTDGNRQITFWLLSTATRSVNARLKVKARWQISFPKH